MGRNRGAVPSGIRPPVVHRSDGRERRRPPSAASPRPEPPDERRSAVVVRMSDAVVDFDSMASTSMFVMLGRVRALPVEHAGDAIVCADIAATRGYERRMLQSIAHVGYEYLQSGGVRVAQVLFEGLCAVSPDWAYAQLARGVCYERRGDEASARRAYETAARLDPGDPQARLNLAELAIRRGQTDLAVRLLRRVLSLDQVGEPQAGRARALLRFIDARGKDQ